MIQQTLFAEPELEYQKGWDGTVLKGPVYAPLAFDTETTVVPIEKECPQFVLGSASDGSKHFILKSEDLAGFILAHQHCHWVGHNFAFDFWVVEQELRRQGQIAALTVWWQMADQGQFHDTMYLDLLVRLATGTSMAPVDTDENSSLHVRNLGLLARKYARIEVDKKDPYRKRYGELLGQSWDQVEEGFFTYAIRDAIATYQIWPRLYAEAVQIQKRFLPRPGDEHYVIYPDAMALFGPLTERIQVQASIALLKISRNGMHVDLEKAFALEQEYRGQLQDKLSYLTTQHTDLFVWKTDRKTGEKSLEIAAKSRLPKIKQDYLKAQLTRIAQEHQIQAPQATGKKGGISLSTKLWSEYRDLDPFLDAWLALSHDSRLLAFFDIFREYGEVIHCRYNVLMRTGRTSCQKPNLQQMPRNQKFRSLFTPRPGYRLLTIDFSAIELRTLAAVCKYKYGFSKMGEIFVNPPPYNDPHSFTAAYIKGMTMDQFLAFQKEHHQEADKDRQQGKALGFGVPGGLGPASLKDYARNNYGVHLSKEEAAKLRHILISEIYPELNEENGYLASTSLKDLSINLGINPKILEEYLKKNFKNPEMALRCMEKVARGQPQKMDGTPYKPEWVDQLWKAFKDLIQMSPLPHRLLRQMIANKQTGIRLVQSFFYGTACTLTGRIRSQVSYTQSRNTPFQSLAADGGKLALWNLIKAGFKVVAWIHDECVVEVPLAQEKERAEEINRIMCQSMAQVLKHTVPVACKYHLADCWSK